MEGIDEAPRVLIAYLGCALESIEKKLKNLQIYYGTSYLEMSSRQALPIPSASNRPLGLSLKSVPS